jgi:transposase
VSAGKFADFLPLNRQRRIYHWLGVDISTTTLAAWIARVAEELEPVYDAIWRAVYKAHLVQTDATGLKVLDRDADENIVLGTMWCYVGDRRHVIFRYTATAEGATGPWVHLFGREGNLLADAAIVFDRLYNGKAARCTEIGCWCHARRRFFKLLDQEPLAARAVDYIGQLYGVEHEADQAGLDPIARQKLRQEKSRPILDRFRVWLDRKLKRFPPKSGMAQAYGYCIRQWRALTRFLDDGTLPLDNNFCELQIRDICVGRKNYLFAGSHAGAKRAAILHSIIRTCAVNGINPREYIEDVLRRLARGWPQSRIDELIPGRWSKQAEEKPQSEST